MSMHQRPHVHLIFVYDQRMLSQMGTRFMEGSGVVRRSKEWEVRARVRYVTKSMNMYEPVSQA